MSEITLTVRLHNALRKRTEDGWQSHISLVLPAGTRVQDLLDRLDLDMPDEAVLAVVDHRAVSADHPLGDGDLIHLIPALSGG